MKELELLAPARDILCGRAAIDHGADAVYVGAPRHGARAAAGNSIDDIASLIEYAHKFNSKVYVTVNTILHDNELEEVNKLIHQLYEIYADAVIIQDMGIMEMDLPPIQLFASTQTHNYSLERIKFLEKVGLKRIILARELSLEQIKEIKRETTVELECFVHGALCVCLSGQCYFSYIKNGRSANRGECSQPCRMYYSLADSAGKIIKKDKYLLSMKDLNLSEHIPQLIDAGITSFKIEGRLKDISYVKNVTAYYRNVLDEFMAGRSEFKKSSSGIIDFEFKPDLEKTFNRGYTKYFLDGKQESIASLYTQKSIGKPAGKVKSSSAEFFTMEGSHDLKNGDGICWFDEQNSLKGTQINNVAGDKIFVDDSKGLSAGCQIFRNKETQFIGELKGPSARRKIRTSINISESEKGITISAVDEDFNEIFINFDCELIEAKNPEKIYEAILKQFSKSGETIFAVNEVKIDLKKNWFFTIGHLNEMRRRLLDELAQKRIASYERKIAVLEKSPYPYPEKLLDYGANVINELSRRFYLRHGVEIIEPGVEASGGHSEIRIMTSRYCIKKELDLCPKNSGRAAQANEPLYLTDNKERYRLKFDCGRCEMSIYFER